MSDFNIGDTIYIQGQNPNVITQIDSDTVLYGADDWNTGYVGLYYSNYPPPDGTISINDLSRVTGTGTHFISDFNIGDTIYIQGQNPNVITQIDSDTVLYGADDWIVGWGGSFNFGGWIETYYFLNNNSDKIDLGDGWNLYYVVINLPAINSTPGYFGLSSIVGTWQFAEAFVGLGNIPPSSWTPAPEDDTAAIAAIQSVIDVQSGKNKWIVSYWNVTGTNTAPTYYDLPKSTPTTRYLLTGVAQQSLLYVNGSQLGYARTALYSVSGQTVNITGYHYGGVTLYVNGSIIFSENGTGVTVNYNINLVLKPGWNVVEILVNNNASGTFEINALLSALVDMSCYFAMDEGRMRNVELVASLKKRSFNATPTTPYEVGDTYTDGTNLYTCITTRLTGSYSSGDWAKRVNYDSTQITMDNGIVTAGSLQVADSSAHVWGGMRGGGYGYDVGLWLGASYANRNTAPFRAYHNGTIVATQGVVGGWTLASDAIYYDGNYANESSGMVPGDYPFYAGSFYSGRATAPFRVDTAGAVVMTKATLSSSATGKRVVISSVNNNMTFYTSAGGYLILDANTNNYPYILFNDANNNSAEIGADYFNHFATSGNQFQMLLRNPTQSNKLFVKMLGLPSTNDIDTSGGKYLGVIPATGEIYFIA
jgi:hypothetical protein